MRSFMQNFLLGMAVHACNPSYLEGTGKRTTVQGKPRKKYETLSENKLKTKGLGACIASMSLNQSTRKKKKNQR
jgi:hypothetical protein